jgi:alpha-beta hydrolase superfamily lysophospholipase
VLVLQGDRDPVVDPDSALLLHRALGSADKAIVMVPSQRHGILYNNTGTTWQEIFAFVERLGRP